MPFISDALDPMHYSKKVFYNTIRLAPVALLKGIDPNQLLLPYQHLVSDVPVPHIKHLYPFKGTKAFEKDLDYLLKHFKPVTLPEVIAAVKERRPLPKYSFLLTFDDGLQEVATHIAPMLLRKGVPAAFFINKNFLDNQELFYKFKVSLIIEALTTRNWSPATLAAAGQLLGDTGGTAADIISRVKKITYVNRQLADPIGEVFELSFGEYLQRERPFMDSGSVQRLVDQGFGIGGHSIDHPYYAELTLAEQIRQTVESVDFVTSKFQLPYKAFAFPHTDAPVSSTFFEQLLEGEQPALDIIFGTANHLGDIHPAILQRFNCERPQLSIETAVKGILVYDIIKKRLLNSVISRSKAI
ncbi:polysaccharide deacetylase family protein [Chitinophaga arvensicola]|uniref:Polysaccharide deacetylase n=1 Tax=Chitinophaga arvensicola TaxID=29529 RepID=A0A1I0S5U0_9BACT|nr:polysaccharide deacetylase family protein [Chitinophaga arvensicola]SEW50285.1 Polysaccharide deacetylase [Chitinophaga arvensicola]